MRALVEQLHEYRLEDTIETCEAHQQARFVVSVQEYAAGKFSIDDLGERKAERIDTADRRARVVDARRQGTLAFTDAEIMLMQVVQKNIDSGGSRCSGKAGL